MSCCVVSRMSGSSSVLFWPPGHDGVIYVAVWHTGERIHIYIPFNRQFRAVRQPHVFFVVLITAVHPRRQIVVSQNKRTLI